MRHNLSEKPLVRRGIWLRLPLHPQPAPLETLTSYVTRLAEANLITTRQLALLAGTNAEWQEPPNPPDFSISNALGLLPLTGCTRANLEKTTLFFFGHHLGVATSALTFRRLLRGSLARSSRYCPLCLAEDAFPYHRLPWRFSALIGCSTHLCSFQDHYTHCKAPLFYHPHRLCLTRCSTCHQDLRDCQPSWLLEGEREKTVRRTKDLLTLLTPPLKSQGRDVRVRLGKRYAFLRQQQGLEIQEVAHLLQKDSSVLSKAIEDGGSHRSVTLLLYLQYADLLGYSLSDLLAMDSP